MLAATGLPPQQALGEDSGRTGEDSGRNTSSPATRTSARTTRKRSSSSQARSQFITPQTPRTFHLSHLHHLFTRAGSCLASFRTPGASRQPAGIGSWKCSLETQHGPRRQSFKRERRHACPPLLSGIYRYLSPPRATTSHQHSGCLVTTRTVTTTSLHLPPPPLSLPHDHQIHSPTPPQPPVTCP